MKLTILGSGTVVPDGARNSAGYFIEAGDVRLMMDCGAGTVHALARYGCDWERLTHQRLMVVEPGPEEAADERVRC